jgi:hypothetical protein
VRVFRQGLQLPCAIEFHAFALLDDAIEFHAFAPLEAESCVWPMAFPIWDERHALLPAAFPVDTVNSVTTLKGDRRRNASMYGGSDGGGGGAGGGQMRAMSARARVPTDDYTFGAVYQYHDSTGM